MAYWFAHSTVASVYTGFAHSTVASVYTGFDEFAAYTNGGTSITACWATRAVIEMSKMYVSIDVETSALK